jgi:phospholipid-transporting ATPase
METTLRKISIGKSAVNPVFCSNSIRTTKYTILTWAPKSLLYQFKRAANIYFLVISILQSMPFSPKNPMSIIATFAGVLFFTMLKEAYEDYVRYKSDQAVNLSTCHVLDRETGEVKDIQCRNVKVGDILQVRENEMFPADLLFLNNHDGKGLAFINTMNLDGETNLKERLAIDSTKRYTSFTNIEGELICDLPNEKLFTWNCNLMINQGSWSPAGLQQLLLRGCVLKNTEYVWGVVVYTGHESKIVLNSKDAPSKMSSVLRRMNNILASVFVFQAIVVFSFAALGVNWSNHNQPSYLPHTEVTTLTNYAIHIMIFYVAFSHLVPISLYVMLELLKLGLAFLIKEDKDLYYAPDDSPASCRTSELVEELGQVQFVFSDKTGTLTCNVMEFKYCSIMGNIYGESPKDTKKQKGTANQFSDANLRKVMENSHEHPHKESHDFFTHLSLCHTVFPTIEEGHDTPKYQAMSPDELALVDGAMAMGYTFYEREDNKVGVLVDGNIQYWELLAVFPFDSDRKRMSVLVRKPESEDVRLFTKGADVTVVPLLEERHDWMEENLRTFACDGLRTLVIAQKKLKYDEIGVWLGKWNELKLSFNNEVELSRHACELEKKLEILGIVAIEDKLQDGVPETLSLLLKAQVRVWVLTGDKQETALEIGKSCNLVQSHMTLIDLSTSSEDLFKENLKSYLNAYSLSNKNFIDIYNSQPSMEERLALIIDGTTLAWALHPENKDDFLRLGLASESCICCRVSPAQKARVVQMVKDQKVWVTLAIGDGANDVNMIQEAHLGVGISGKEGTQAVQSSDFAISQFRYLGKLLLAHGRLNYRRICWFICYYFYKNIVVVVTELFFSIYSGFSGQVFFLDWLSMLFNALWASWPCLVTYWLEQDIDPATSMRYPVAYGAGQKGVYFSYKRFWLWMAFAAFHGVVCFWSTMIGVSEIVDETGKTSGLFWTSTISFILVIHTITYKLYLETCSWNWLNLVATLISLAIFYASVFLLSAHFIASKVQPMFDQLLYTMLISPKAWLMIYMTPILAVMPDFILTAWRSQFHPSPIDIIMRNKK